MTSRPEAPREARGPLGRFATFTAVSLGLLILGALGYLQARQFNEAGDLAQEVRQSYEARAQIEGFLSLHQNIETGQRGFALTGNREFLDPYSEGKEQLAPALQQLRARFLDDPELSRSTAELAVLSQRKLAFSERVIKLRKEQGGAAAAALIASGEGKVTMDAIRAAIGRMSQIERDLLDERIAKAERSREAARWTTFGLEAMLLLLLVLAGLAIRRSLQATRSAVKRFQDLSARQQAIFDAATDGMITHDPAGSIESLNPAAARLFQCSKEDLVGTNIRTLFKDPPEQAKLDKFLARLAADPSGPAAQIMELEAKRRNGTIFPLDVATSPVRLADGLHFIAVMRDATERKRVDQMKTEFVSTVSHELRTPLTSIAGSLGLLSGGAAGELPDRAARLIKIAHENSVRLVRLINDILDVEKIESGKMNFELKQVALKPLIEQAIQANAGFAAEYGVDLRLEVESENATVIADADRLTQVLTNLLSNGAKFSPKGSEVVTTIKSIGKTHRITVTDQGSGIPDEFKSRIFSKFAQADSSDTRQKGGTGLGLSIVKAIVEGLGGRIGFDSKKGEGTSFHVDLPAVAPAKASVEPLKVLIGQDDEEAGRRIQETLLKAGYASEIAFSSSEVRKLASENSYAVVLLDLTLTGEQSVGLIHHLRSDPRYASTPILMASPHGSSGQVSQALAVVNWLHKPVSAAELVGGLADASPSGRIPCILHIEDDQDVLRVVASAFEGRAELKSVADLDEAREALREGCNDLVILDLGLPGGSGLELLPEMRRPDGTPIPVVIFTAQDDDPEIARRVEAMLTKSRASLDDLVVTVERLVGTQKTTSPES